MTDSSVGVTNQSAGTGVALVDVSQLTVGGSTVERQRIVIADSAAAGNFAAVTSLGLSVDTTGSQGTGGTGISQPTGGVGILGWLSGIYSRLSGAATSANQPVINGDGGALAHVTNLPTTQAISAASLPLPSPASRTRCSSRSTPAPVRC